VYEGFDKLGKTLREHNKAASILERAVQNSNEENKPGFRLVINASMSDTADRRQYSASVLNREV